MPLAAFMIWTSHFHQQPLSPALLYAYELVWMNPSSTFQWKCGWPLPGVPHHGARWWEDIFLQPAGNYGSVSKGLGRGFQKTTKEPGPKGPLSAHLWNVHLSSRAHRIPSFYQGLCTCNLGQDGGTFPGIATNLLSLALLVFKEPIPLKDSLSPNMQ
jgi:hypothetical protein